MRILVLSDVHGNLYGLQAVLEEVRGCDAILCLGDIVGYGAHPNECCEILRQRGALCLAGNHDAAALGQINIDGFNPTARAAILWTQDQLTRQNREWLATLPPQMDFPDWDCQAVHASLRQPLLEYVSSPEAAAPTMLAMSRSLCLLGHTHEAVRAFAPRDRAQWTRPEQLSWNPLPRGGHFALKPEARFLVNPGSCGQPRDGNPQARCALVDTARRTVDIRGVDYDYFAACAAIYEAGLPKSLGDRLFEGR